MTTTFAVQYFFPSSAFFSTLVKVTLIAIERQHGGVSDMYFTASMVTELYTGYVNHRYGKQMQLES